MMPQTGKTQRAPARKSKITPQGALIDIADTLYRTAVTTCVEHRRYADLVEKGASDSEQKSARTAARQSDDALDEAVDLYELACLKESNHADDQWWHKANRVWKAAKEYLGHHDSSEKLTRGGGNAEQHGRAALLELTIEYKLEASALLKLRHTIDDYRGVRPEVAAAAEALTQ
jgi:hypothetical protein